MKLDEVLRQIATLKTERKEVDITTLSPAEIVKLSIMDNIYGISKIEDVLDRIVEAGNIWAKTLISNGRIVMVGAGTSGRLAIMEAAEMYPTFGIEKDRIKGFIAGGRSSVFSSKEGAEDQEKYGKALVSRLKLDEKDMLIGLSASGRTPYVKGAIEKAKDLRCKTVIISTNPEDRVLIKADINICVDVGSEILPGSTRMKSATVQKVILNTISLIGAVISGKVYKGRMVELKPTSWKLKARAIKTLMEEFNISKDKAIEILESTNWNLKKAFEKLEGE